MQRYIWSRLNHLQVGKYTEYFVKMELTMHGFEVYTTEVDVKEDMWVLGETLIALKKA